ncbi:hypothetical protein [Bacillus solitudinis]|uniref:hypothetical protein n=1 Tax=Bacillus solitudinis TaxID=2014074 RepID=UPI000C2403DF|nr:hypothetical protein [Bacillus solitudinis]
MIYFDEKHSQILTNSCMNCQEKHFQPPNEQVPRVGCCSYSPVLGLFEIAKIIKQNESFLHRLLQTSDVSIHPYHIVVHAKVHSTFAKEDIATLSVLEQEDLKTSYSVCQFFEETRGCTLPPSFKNTVCRSFICSTVELSFTPEEHLNFKKWTQNINKEADNFHREHKLNLQKKSIDIKNNTEKVISYFKVLTN